MRKMTVIALTLLCLAFTASHAAQDDEKKPCCANSACNAKETKNSNDSQIVQKTVEDNELDNILKQLGEKTKNLKSYQGKVEYLFIQDPEMLDSRALRKGKLYYRKEKNRSQVRVDFETLKQDDAKEEKNLQQFLFDGVWLIRIDHELKKADYQQQALEDKPIDVFTFISHHFPAVGFADTEMLSKQFQISLPQPISENPNEPIQLHLKVKEDSEYKEDYKMIDFWIDRKLFLPVRVRAVSTEDDISDIKFLDPSLNKKLDNKVFKVETPSDFDKNITPLKDK